MRDLILALRAESKTIFLSSHSGAATATDANGNQLTVNSSGQFFDTLSSAAVLTVAGSGTPASPLTYTYTAPSGGNAIYTMAFTQYTVATDFGLSTITDYGRTSVPLVSSITLPDSSKYSFSYRLTRHMTALVYASTTLLCGFFWLSLCFSAVACRAISGV